MARLLANATTLNAAASSGSFYFGVPLSDTVCSSLSDREHFAIKRQDDRSCGDHHDLKIAQLEVLKLWCEAFPEGLDATLVGSLVGIRQEGDTIRHNCDIERLSFGTAMFGVLMKNRFHWE
jgi:hypothetical protein